MAEMTELEKKIAEAFCRCHDLPGGNHHPRCSTDQLRAKALIDHALAAERQDAERRVREVMEAKIYPGRFNPCGVCAQRSYQHTCDQMLDEVLTYLRAQAEQEVDNG